MSMQTEIIELAERRFYFLPKTSKDLVLGYIRHLLYRKTSPATIKANIYCLSLFLRRMNSKQREDLTRIGKKQVRRFVEQRRRERVSASTVNSYLSHIKRFYGYLADEDYYPANNPVLKRYYIEKPRRLPRPMSKEDTKRFVANLISDEERAMFLLMLRSGLRIGEVARLKMEDINWDRKSLSISDGKGQADRVVYFFRKMQRMLLWAT